MADRFVPNMAAIRRIRTRPEVTRGMLDYARMFLREVERLSPVEEGDYRRAWQISTFITTRGGVVVFNDDYKAWWIEYGVRAHGNHPGYPAHHVALRARQVFRRQ